MDSCIECGSPMLGKELKLSWSQLRYYDECKQKAYLLRTGKRPSDADIRVFFPGTVVDRCMRAYLSLDDPAPDGFMTRSVKSIMDKEEETAKESGDGIVKWKHRADRIEVLEFCIELVKRLEPLLWDLVIPHQYEPSKRFKVPVNIPYLDNKPTPILLIGEMDILVKTVPEQELPWVVWDLKATKNDQYWRSTISQLVFYDICVYLMFKKYTSQVGLIQPMCKQQTVAMTVTNQQRVDMMQRIIGMAHSIWRAELYAGTPAGDKEIEVRPDTKHCFMCSVKSSCYRFQPIGHRMQLGIGSLDNIEPDTVLQELLEM